MSVDLAARRLHAQRLVGARLPSPEAVVGWLGAVQAQDFPGAVWGVVQRTSEPGAAAVERAFDAGAILRTHVLRPTWHLVRPADLRWMLALTAPRVRAALAPYDRRLEIDGALLARSHALLEGALRGGRHRTRWELAGVLDAGGIAARGSRLAHLVMHAELDGLVVSGPRRGKQHTYALLDERVPAHPPLPRDEALATLARRYFRSHGPATPHDFAWWSGLTVTDARAALALLRSDVEHAGVGGTTYWWATGDAPGGFERPVVHLLPNYDEHVVAYRDHGPSLDPAAPRALDGWGTARTTHLVVRNGLVVGGWRRSLHRDRVEVRTNVLVALTNAERAALRNAAEAYGRFLSVPVTLETP